jgi:O-antigen/teichoic acid export membrane protein
MYKKLLGDTAIYGLSTVLLRLFPFIINPIITSNFGLEAYAPFTDFYSMAGVFIVLLTHGMETSFFRYISKGYDMQKLLSTTGISIVAATVLFLGLSYLFHPQLLVAFKSQDWGLMQMMLLILALDACCAIPFVRLRQQGKTKKYALVKIANGLLNFVLIVFFIQILPNIKSDGFVGFINSLNFGIGYVFLANLLASALTLLLLYKELKIIKLKCFDVTLWKEMLRYSWPITVAGLAGIINETMDRQFLKYLLPEGIAKSQMALYGAAYKLVTFMALFRQAYLLGVEPFFFSEAKKEDSHKSYALLMKWFVIVNCLILLSLTANLSWLGPLYLQNKVYYEGIAVVPVLLIASVFLGVYLNLSVWYKLNDKTIYGAYLSGIGAVVTIVINYIFIPHYSYWAAAYATLLSYVVMTIFSYYWGQKHFPIKYPMRKIMFYLGVSIAFSVLSYYGWSGNAWLGNLLLIVFVMLLFYLEKGQLLKLLKRKI